ncbi:MAG: choice-of-anchor tandem repeat GloVer-containing protein, partial [Ignavibacteria bacterium]
MKTFFLLSILISILSGLNCSKSEKYSPVIFSFNGNNGATPKGTMTLSPDNTLFGYTSAGGKNGKGVIFKMKNDGKDYSVIYNFEEGSDNGLGKEPHHDQMLYFDGAFYGSALYGGSQNNGVIFKINLDGSGYAPIHIFKGGDSDGAQSHSGVISGGQILYGMTALGGTQGHGTIYKIDPDGNNFSVIYSFHKSSGHEPHGRLTLGSDGHTLYGITKSGGDNDVGVVFSFDINNSVYIALHTFQKGIKEDGYTSEHGYLAMDNNILFGLTQYGGVNDKGTIFSLKTDGSDYKLLHSFGSDSKDGKSPFGSLKMLNGFLYGTTQDGGENDRGTVFKIQLDGKDHEILYSFDCSTSGEYPIDNVTFSNSKSDLYCFSQQGGENDPDGKKNFGTIIK